MAEVEIRLQTKSGTPYVVNRFNGLKSFSTTTQSTANPKQVSYGLIANTGTAQIIDVDGRIKELIDSGEIESKNVQATIWIDDNQVASHITEDSKYSPVDKTLDLSFTNDVAGYYDMDYHYSDGFIEEQETLKNILDNLIYRLNWQNGVDYYFGNNIFWNGSGFVNAGSYLNQFSIKYPYFLEHNVGYVIDCICQVAQLNAFKDIKGRLIFVNAIPRINGVLNVNDTRIIRIPRKMQVTLPDGSIFREGQADNIKYNKKTISQSVGEIYNNSFNLRDYNDDLTLSSLGEGATIITQNGFEYLCFFVKVDASANTIDLIKANIYGLDNNAPYNYEIKYTNGTGTGGHLASMWTDDSDLQNISFYSLANDLTILTKYTNLQTAMFAVKLKIEDSNAQAVSSSLLKSIELQINAKKYKITYDEAQTANENKNILVFDNNDLISTEDLYNSSTNIYDFWALNTITFLSSGVKTLKITVFAGDYYAYNLLNQPITTIDYSNNHEVIQIDQNLIIDADNSRHSMFNDTNGNPIVWRVTNSTIRYEGAVYVDLELQESYNIQSKSFAEDSWETIGFIANYSDPSRYYSVGDEKTITLSNGEEITLCILDFNHDTLTSGGTAKISIGMKELMANTYKISSLDTIYDLLPEDLKRVIKSCDKTTIINSSFATQVISSKLWLLGKVEIDGAYDDYDYRVEGTQYTYWNSIKNGGRQADRIKYLSNGSGNAATWFLRTHTSQQYVVTTNGAYGLASGAPSYGISFGFCI